MGCYYTLSVICFCILLFTYTYAIENDTDDIIINNLVLVGDIREKWNDLSFLHKCYMCRFINVANSHKPCVCSVDWGCYVDWLVRSEDFTTKPLEVLGREWNRVKNVVHKMEKQKRIDLDKKCSESCEGRGPTCVCAI